MADSVANRGLEKLTSVGDAAPPWHSTLTALLACLAILAGFLLVSEECMHWFVVPVTLCGVLISIEAVEWLRGRLPLLDPLALVGLYGTYFFFVDPLLLVAWRGGLAYGLDDPRPWLGLMAILSATGLVFYRLLIRGSDRAPRRAGMTIWRLDSRRFLSIIMLVLPLSLTSQVVVYAVSGGVRAYLGLYMLDYARDIQYIKVLYPLSEHFPVFLMMAYLVYVRHNRMLRPRLDALVTTLCVLLCIPFGGFRTSRNNVLWRVFTILALRHLKLSPLSKWGGIAAVTMGLLFLWLVGVYYKSGLGMDVLEARLRGGDPEIVQRAHSMRGPQSLLLGSIGRTTGNALLISRIWRPGSDYRYALGETYLHAISPAIGHGHIGSRRQWATDALFGMGTYQGLDGPHTKRVFGIIGEAMLNFGPMAIPFAVALFGLVVRATRSAWQTWPASGDARVLLLPAVILLGLQFLAMDLVNVKRYAIQHLLLPFVLVHICSRKTAGTLRGAGS